MLAMASATLLNNKNTSIPVWIYHQPHKYGNNICHSYTINHTNMATTSAIVMAITFATVYMAITSAMTLHMP